MASSLNEISLRAKRLQQSLQLLGFSRGTAPSRTEVTKAYRERMKVAHPDRNGGTEAVPGTASELAIARSELDRWFEAGAPVSWLADTFEGAEIGVVPSQPATGNVSAEAFVQFFSDVLRPRPAATAETRPLLPKGSSLEDAVLFLKKNFKNLNARVIGSKIVVYIPFNLRSGLRKDIANFNGYLEGIREALSQFSGLQVEAYGKDGVNGNVRDWPDVKIQIP